MGAFYDAADRKTFGSPIVVLLYTDDHLARVLMTCPARKE